MRGKSLKLTDINVNQKEQNTESFNLERKILWTWIKSTCDFQFQNGELRVFLLFSQTLTLEK